jgi:sigma-B regulation protein RsbU (phosphoserine phosphatase)
MASQCWYPIFLKDDRYRGNIDPGDNPNRSEVALPLMIGDRVLGVLQVEDTVINAFSEEDQQILGFLTGQIAVAFENISLYEETRMRIEELADLNRELTLLDQINAVLNKESDLNTMIRLAVEAIVETSGYNMVCLFLLNGDILEVQHYLGYDEIGRLRNIPIATGVNGRVVRTRQASLVEDIHTESGFCNGSGVYI